MFSEQTLARKQLCCEASRHPIEPISEEGFDNGVTPWVAVYTRQVYDEATGEWLATEYSLDADFTTLYVPVGDIIPSVSVENSINLGSQVIDLTNVPQGFTIPALANSCQIESVGEGNTSFANYSYDGDPIGGAFHRLGNGQPLIVHNPNMGLFLSVLGVDSKPCALHVHYHYNPKPNDHG